MKALFAQSIALAVIAIGGVLVSPAEAILLSITNPSFEDPALAPGGFVGFSTGWVAAGGTRGTFRPTAIHVNSVPDGVNVGFANAGGNFSQTLADTLENNTIYTLNIQIGQRLDNIVNPFPTSYSVDLLAGGATIASGSIPAPTPGDFAPLSIQFISAASDPNFGQALGISIANTNLSTSQLMFDAVTLDATPVPFEFEASLGLIALSAMFGGYTYLKKKNRKQITQ